MGRRACFHLLETSINPGSMVSSEHLKSVMFTRSDLPRLGYVTWHSPRHPPHHVTWHSPNPDIHHTGPMETPSVCTGSSSFLQQHLTGSLGQH